MALQKQLVPISLKQGIDTKTDSKQLVVGKLSSLENGFFQKNLQMNKRPGFRPYPKNSLTNDVYGIISTGISTYSYNNETLIQDQNQLYSFQEKTNTWISKSTQLRNFDFKTKSVYHDQISKSNPVMVYDQNTDLEFYAYIDNRISQSVTYYSVIERSTGNIIVSNSAAAINGAVNIQVLLFQGKFVLFLADQVTLNLNMLVIDPTAPYTVPSLISIAAMDASLTFDTVIIGNSIYTVVVNGSAINVYLISSSFAVTARAAISTTGLTQFDSLNITGIVNTRILVSYSSITSGNNGTYVAVYNDTTATSTQFKIDTNVGVSVNAIIDPLSGNAQVIYQVFTPTTPQVNSIFITSFSSTNVIGTPVPMQAGCTIQSKAFFYNGFLYYFVCPIASEFVTTEGFVSLDTSQETLYLVGYDLLNLVTIPYAKIEMETYGVNELEPAHPLPSVQIITENGISKILFAYLDKSQVTSENGKIEFILGVKEIDLWQSTENTQRQIISKNLVFTGGMLYEYDGENVVESGFNTYPAIDINNSKINPTGGAVGPIVSGSTTNQKQYCAVYEWIDNNGQLHRSAPSIPYSVTILAGSPPNSRTAYNFTGSVFGSTTIITTIPYATFIQNVVVGDGLINSPLTLPPGTYVTSITNNGGLAAVGFSGIGLPDGGSNFTRPASGAGYVISFTQGSKIITGAPGVFQIGQKLLNLVTGSSPFLDGSLVVSANGGTYTLDTIQTGASGTANVYAENTQSSQIYVTNLSLTLKKEVSIALYATTTDGTVFYRTSSIAYPVVNSTTDYEQFLVDNLSDFALQGNEQLYTTGGELENIAPPAPSAIQFYKNRIVLIPKDNPLTEWYSKQSIAGFGLEFNDEFLFNVNAPDGQLVASGFLDEKLILFKENSIYYVVGEGPNPTGTQNDFSSTQLINSDAGCAEKRSLVNIPMGLMFKSKKGIYILNRSFGVEYIGDDVEAYNSNNIIAAKLLSAQNLVCFHLDNGVVLVYDYYHKQWSTKNNVSGCLDANDAEIVQGIYSFLTADGTLKQETAGQFADTMLISGTETPTYIPISFDTGWLSFADVEAYQRIWKMILMGNYISNHNLSVQIYYDFNESYFDTVTINDVFSTPPPGIYQYRVFMPRQKCTSMRFKITEVQYQTTIGEGLSLSSMTLEVGKKRGLNKIGDTNSYGGS